MGDDHVCPECNFNFTKKKNLYAHLKIMHKYVKGKGPVQLKRVKNRIVRNELCDYCGKLFVNKSILSYHLKNVHNEDMNVEVIKKLRLLCPQRGCLQWVTCYESLREHLRIFHNIKIEYEEFQFRSTTAFRQWKHEIQKKSVTRYVHTSCKLLSNKNMRKYYSCYRSHNHIVNGKNKKDLKSTGVNTIGRVCPSRMEVYFKNQEGTVSVKFWKTHIGHSLDIDRMFPDRKCQSTEILGSSLKDAKLEPLPIKKEDIHNIATDENDPLDTNITLPPQGAQPTVNDVIKKRAELVIDLCNTAFHLTEEKHRSVLNGFDEIIHIIKRGKARKT